MTKNEQIWDARIERVMRDLDRCVKYCYGEKPEEWTDEDVRCEAHKALSVLQRLMK